MINNFAPIGLIRFSLPSSVFWTIEFCPPSSLYVSAPKKFMEVNWEFIRPHEDGGPDEYWCLFLRWWLVDHRVQFLKLENSRGLKAETAVSGDGPGFRDELSRFMRKDVMDFMAGPYHRDQEAVDLAIEILEANGKLSEV